MSMAPALDLCAIDQLAGSRLGVFDVACPLCGPLKRKAASQRKPSLRIWRTESGFATYHCARCGEQGYARDGSSSPIDRAAIERARAEAAERDRVTSADRLSKARWLWKQRQPLRGSIGERYLREARGYQGPLPGTLGFLPTRGEHAPAVIAAFGLPNEPEPGRLSMPDARLVGVHITRLASNGLSKAGTDADKIMLGHSAGWPIVLAPPNDLLGLVITEGIEDALSAHAVTGLGAWAAGAASRMPALAEVLPAYLGCVTILADADHDGQRHAAELAARLEQRGLEVRYVVPKLRRAA